MDIYGKTLEIRNMNTETVEAVAELERLCFASPWSLASLTEELANPLAVFRTAEIGGKIVGYVGMHHVIDEGYITNIAVLPDYREQGIARVLMNELIGYGGRNSLRMITLEVRESNAAARRLYESLRFEVAGKRKNFYSRPVEDAVLMTREF